MSGGTLERARELAGYDEVSALRQAQDLDWVLGLAAVESGNDRGAAAGPRSVLDLGCGTGALLERARARWPSLARIAGVDGAPGRVAEARARLGAGADVTQGDLRSLDGREEVFDLITSTSVLHWLYPDEERTLAWIAAHLAPDGAFVLTTHHPHVGPDGLGAEDVVVRDALAELHADGVALGGTAAGAGPEDPGSDVGRTAPHRGALGSVIPMARRARPVDDVAALLDAAFAVDVVQERVVPVRTASAEEYARFHASTFGTYFSRLVDDARQEAFFAAVGRAAERRQRRDGAVYEITVRAWRGRARAAG